MARRRRTGQQRGDGQALPAHLAVCYVEEWTVPGDGSHMVGSSPDADPAEDYAAARAVVARRRWEQARWEWAAAHGVDWRELPRERAAPTWLAG